MEMNERPYCHMTTRQNRCRHTTIPLYALPAEIHTGTETTSYPDILRKRAAEMYVDGMNLRKIVRHLKVRHRTIALSVNDHAEALPNAPMPDEVKDAEMDELFTFIGDKKQYLYPYTCRPHNALLVRLGRRLGANSGSDSTSGGSSTQSQMVLLGWF